MLGTDANQPGKLWVFSFLLGAELDVTLGTDTWPEQPGIKLFSNRGGDNTLADLLKVRLSNSNIVLDHGDGTSVLVEGYQPKTSYLVECRLDMEADTLRVLVDGQDAGVTFNQITPSATKGVGGFQARGGSNRWSMTLQSDLIRLDNISLVATAIPNRILDFVVSDQDTGSTASTNGTTVGLSFDVVGPGYSHHIIEVGDAPPAPVDETDPRWAAGDAPATIDLGAPSDGDIVTVTMWLLDLNNAIAEASASILYATSDPGISNVAAAPGVLEATITWDTTVPAGGRVFYDADGAPYDNVSAFEAGVGTSHSVTLTGLEPGVTYFFAVESNEVISDGHSFAYLTDTPSIINIQIDNSEWRTFTVTWETDTAAIGWVQYGVQGQPLTSLTDYGPLTVTHTAVLTGLELDTGYAMYIHSNGAISPLLRARTRDPGMFTIQFETENTALGDMAVDLGPYLPGGMMLAPTGAKRNGEYRGIAVVAPGNGFASQYARIYTHAGDNGDVTITPPIDHVDPLPGTDANPAGNDPWVFSFEIGVDAIATLDTTNWSLQPGIVLLTNRGGTVDFPGDMEELLQVRLSSSNVVLDYLDGGGVAQQIVLGAQIQGTVLKVECTLDMITDTLTLSVNDTPVAGTFGFLTGATDKGVGGFEASGHAFDTWQNLHQGPMHFDNISLTGGAPLTWPVPGDANLDCKVNILDMIFIRNKLNQDPETEDNWRADVTKDGSINILDMIYVRNRLNTQCEE